VCVRERESERVIDREEGEKRSVCERKVRYKFCA